MTYGTHPFYNFSPYPTNMAPQQRINQLEAQYAQYSQPQGKLNALPVGNIEEARAYIVDMQGTPTLFYNASKNEVYLKRTNVQTGSADFFVFQVDSKAKNESNKQNSTDISKDDLKLINDKLDTLCGMFENKTTKKGTAKNDE